MRRFTSKLIIAAVAGSALMAPAAFAAGPPSEQEMVAMQDKFLAALYGTDLKAISDMLSEDLTFIHPTGQFLSKKGEMDLMTNGPLPHYQKLTEKVAKVRVYGKAAALSGDITYQALPKNGVLPPTTTYRFTSAWADENGTWRLVNWEQTSIAPPRPPRRR